MGDVRVRVGKNVKKLRAERKLTQEELSHKAKLHQTYLSGIEGGKRNATIVILEQLAGALGVDVARLFER